MNSLWIEIKTDIPSKASVLFCFCSATKCRRFIIQTSLGFCVGTFGPRVQWVWCSARDNIQPVPRVQAVNACPRVTVNPSARTAKKLRKPQPCYLPPLWSVQLATETPQIMICVFRGATREQSSMDKGLPVAPYFPPWIRTGGCRFSSALINLALYWMWSWWLMAYYPGKVVLLIKTFRFHIFSGWTWYSWPVFRNMWGCWMWYLHKSICLNSPFREITRNNDRSNVLAALILFKLHLLLIHFSSLSFRFPVFLRRAEFKF